MKKKILKKETFQTKTVKHVGTFLADMEKVESLPPADLHF